MSMQQGKIYLGWGDGVVVIDVQTEDGKCGIITSMNEKELVLELIQNLQHCLDMAFTKVH